MECAAGGIFKEAYIKKNRSKTMKIFIHLDSDELGID